jgi:hypothetical protein
MPTEMQEPLIQVVAVVHHLKLVKAVALVVQV